MIGVDPILLPFLLGTAAVICGCAWGAWWWSTTRLAQSEATAVYDIEEAVDFAAARLPSEVDARLDRDQLRYLISMHLAFLRRAGMATFGGVDEIAMEAANTGEIVVAHEDEAVDFIVAQLGAAGDSTPVIDVVVVVSLSNEYLGAIGALGPSVALGDEAE